MKKIMQKLMPLIILSGSAGYSINAMNQKVTLASEMSSTMVIKGFEHLPKDIKRYIIYLLLQSNLYTLSLENTLQRGNTLSSIEFHPDKELYVTTSHDTVSLWSLKTNELVATLIGHTHEIFSVAFSSNGETVLTGSFDTTARTWNSKTGEPIKTFEGRDDLADLVIQVAFSPQGEIIGVVFQDGRVCVWNSASGDLLTTFQINGERMFSLAFCLDGKTMFIGSEKGNVYVGYLQLGKLIKAFKAQDDFPNVVRKIACSPQGETMGAVFQDGRVCVWNSASGDLLTTTFQVDNDRMTSLAFSPDGEMMFTGSKKGNLYVWDSKTRKLVATIKGHTHRITSIACNLQEKTIFTGSNDLNINRWKLLRGSEKLSDSSFELFKTYYPLLRATKEGHDEEPKKNTDQ